MQKTLYITTIILILLLSTSIASLLDASSLTKEGFVYDDKGKRDPFVPIITKERKIGRGLLDVRSRDEIVLEGIVWDTRGNSIAILNGVVMKEGQKEGNVKVEKIEQKSITLYINDEKHKINLIKKGDELGDEE